MFFERTFFASVMIPPSCANMVVQVAWKYDESDVCVEFLFILHKVRIAPCLDSGLIYLHRYLPCCLYFISWL